MAELIRFDAPVGTPAERAGLKLWPGALFDATGFNVPYPPYLHRADYHTGADLNLNAPHRDADAHAPAYAVCFGFVTFAGSLPVWGKVVTIKHALEDGRVLWSRYAHLETIKVNLTQMVARGDQVGTIGNAAGTQAYHLHFDLARVDLGQRPGDWPGTARARLLRDYVNPLEFIRARHVAAEEHAAHRRSVTAKPHLHVRAGSGVDTTVVGQLETGTVVTIISERDGWGLIGSPVAGWISLAYTQVVA